MVAADEPQACRVYIGASNASPSTYNMFCPDVWWSSTGKSYDCTGTKAVCISCEINFKGTGSGKKTKEKACVECIGAAAGSKSDALYGESSIFGFLLISFGIRVLELLIWL